MTNHGQEAFKLLFPGIQQPKDFAMLPNRREILLSLHEYLVGSAGVVDSMEPRLKPMVAWCARKAREKFCSDMPAAGASPCSSLNVVGSRSASSPTPVTEFPCECFGDSLCILSFQVNLCEWRKFRNNVDVQREAKRGNSC
jgi:hypothetical protein